MFNDAVFNADYAVRLRGHARVVGYDDHCDMLLAVEAFQQFHHFDAGGGVKGAGGLVSEDDLRTCD